MSFIHETADRDHRHSFAKGAATFGDVFDAVRDQLILIDNFNASQAALDRAYQERIDQVRQATGIELEHPMRQADREMSELTAGGIRARDRQASDLPEALERHGGAFMARLEELEKQFPDHADRIRAGVPITEDVMRLVQGAEARANQVIGSRDDFVGKWGAILSGGFAGSLRDPLNVGALFLGAGSAARTAGGRILSVALKEAAINAGVEAAAQPIVQDWRRRNGLDHGFQQAAENVAFAAAFGGAFGAAGRGAGELLSRAARRNANEAGFDAAAAELPDDNPLKNLDVMDPAEVAEVASPLRVALQAQARGALDRIEAEKVKRAPYEEFVQKFEGARSAAEARRGSIPPPPNDDIPIDGGFLFGRPAQRDQIPPPADRVDVPAQRALDGEPDQPPVGDGFLFGRPAQRDQIPPPADRVDGPADGPDGDLAGGGFLFGRPAQRDPIPPPAEVAEDLADKATAWAERPERADLNQQVAEGVAAVRGDPRPDPRPDPREGTRPPERATGGIDDIESDVEDPAVTAALDRLDLDELDEIPIPAGADGEGVDFVPARQALRDANKSNDLADLVEACKVI